MHRRSALQIGLAAFLLGCGGPPPPSAPSPLLGKMLPDFRRRALDGSEIDTARGRGRVVVVDFFAKSCEPCRRTLPELEALHRAEPEVLVVGVAEDESVSDANEVVSAHQLTFEVVHDQGNVLSGRFRVSDLPITFVAGPGGAIHWVGDARVTQDGLSRAIAAARRAQPSP